MDPDKILEDVTHLILRHRGVHRWLVQAETNKGFVASAPANCIHEASVHTARNVVDAGTETCRCGAGVCCKLTMTRFVDAGNALGLGLPSDAHQSRPTCMHGHEPVEFFAAFFAALCGPFELMG